MPPEFFADIYLFPTEAGGRQQPLRGGEWRTILGINNEHWSARLTFAGQPLPGDTFRAGVQLLFPEKALQYFAIGAESLSGKAAPKALGGLCRWQPNHSIGRAKRAAKFRR